jgi:hypothetical protein
VLLGIETRALHKLGKCSTTEIHLSNLMDFNISNLSFIKQREKVLVLIFTFVNKTINFGI